MMAQDFMARALEQAELAGARGDVPVGAVVIDAASGAILAAAGNRVEADRDATAHAEILVIREAGRRMRTPKLVACDLYVTLEPCAMCAAAIAFARIRRVFFGAYDAKGGGIDHGPRFFEQPTCHHRPEVIGGILEQRCGDLLRDFFRAQRLSQR